MSVLSRVSLAAVLVAILGHSALGGLVVLHSGLSNPTGEGWVPSAASVPGGITVGPIANDAGTGYDAWQVADNATTGRYYYTHDLTGKQWADAAALGWRADMIVRIPDSDDATDGGTYFNFYELGTWAADGSRDYYLDVGSDASGNLIVDFENKPTYNAGSGGYHLLSMVYDPLSPGSVDVYVDGNLAATDYTGRTKPTAFAASESAVRFGATSTGGVGTGNYNLVAFTTIPEPSTIVMLATAALAGLGVVWRRRR